MTRFFPGHFSDNSLTVKNIPDISLTCFKCPDISRFSSFSRQVVTLDRNHTYLPEHLGKVVNVGGSIRLRLVSLELQMILGHIRRADQKPMQGSLLLPVCLVCHLSNSKYTDKYRRLTTLPFWGYSSLDQFSNEHTYGKETKKDI